MNKKIFGCICGLVIAIALLIGAYLIFDKPSKEISDITFYADNYQFSYEELKSHSQIIALIQVMDELTEANSEAFISEGYTVGNIGRRQCKVLKYFKDERNYGETLTVLEPASVIDNQYIHPEDYDKLEKDNIYLVFLCDETATNELSLMSAYNGTFDVDNLDEMDEYYDLAIKAIVEYMTDLPDKQKEAIIDSDEIVKASAIEGVDIQTQIIGIDEEITLLFKMSSDGQMNVQVTE